VLRYRLHSLHVLLLLLLAALLRSADAQHKDPSPQIITTNLPRVCSSGQRPTQVQDVTDSTSYYVCCGGDTPVVRKTCRCVDFGRKQLFTQLLQHSYVLDITRSVQHWHLKKACHGPRFEYVGLT
jgi:hypothetical protein